MSVGRFLAGIAALIWNPEDNRYLVLRRADHRDYGAGAWECVTGRVDQGEGYEDALHREVMEEIGISIQVEFMIATTHFNRGAKDPSTELLGVMYGCTPINLDDFRIGDEHSEYKWLTPQEIHELLPPGYWLRTLVERAEYLKAHTPEELRREFRKGFSF